MIDGQPNQPCFNGKSASNDNSIHNVISALPNVEVKYLNQINEGYNLFKNEDYSNEIGIDSNMEAS